jgi:hypothetical protein
MARISDPDKLSRSDAASTGVPTGNVYFDLTNKTIELISTTDGWSAGSGNELISAGYNDGGVDLQTVYSFLKEAWKTETDLIRYPFPMEAITAEQFEFINGWRLTNSSDTGLVDSIPYIRNGGWAERNASGVIVAQYVGVVTLGNIDTTRSIAHTVYYAFDGDNTTRTNFSYQGPVNEPVLFYVDTAGDGTAEVNYTNSVLEVYIRSQPDDDNTSVTGWTYDKSTTDSIGVSQIANQVYRFPLSESVDINITKLDTEIASGGTGAPDTAPYNDMRIEYYSTVQPLDVGGTDYDFKVVIDANADGNGTNPSLVDIYQFTQYQLRQTSDISAAPGDESGVIGVLADDLVTFVGATLKTIRQSDNDGVYIEDFNLDAINNVVFVDDSGEERSFPFKATVTLSFNDNLIQDPNSKYFLFYSSVPTGDFGTGNAVLVVDDSSNNVTGDLHSATFTPTSGGQTGTGGSVTAGGVVLSGLTGYTADDLIGQVLEITSGDNAGKYFIVDNDATTITVDAENPFEVSDASVAYSILQKNTGSVQFVYNYAGNTDGGRTENTPANVVFVALGLDKAQYVSTTSTITETSTITIPITAALERNYSDPVGI